ncbi:MAG: signal recognition particle protein [Rickettsiales bacterium]|nr:signal recognition particle protein [Rickettsiales bacterium]
MFDNFSNKITKIFDGISGKKHISEDDLNSAMREIRIALLEADVSLPIAKDFINKIKEEALGQQVVKSVSAGQMIIKIVNDALVTLLGSEKSEINFNAKPPIVILMAGLQGAGKTTTSGKLALLLKQKKHKRILLASLDTYRPAAAEQLKILANKIDVDIDEFDESSSPILLAKKAYAKAKEFAYDALILDTAGRTHVDEKMMDEIVEISKETSPTETLLVVDAMIGQDAVNVAKNFGEKLDLTGVILTRLDGDARGGAALTMKAATNCPIKFIGVGEKLHELEEFNPDRIASRIVGMGDVVSLVEKAQEVMDEKEMEKAKKKLEKGSFDLDDLLSQIRNMKKMGGLSSIIKFMPGAGKLREHMGKIGDVENEVKVQEAMILSMTKKERQRPDILNSSRKRRIAAGSGATIQEVNRLLKKYKQMQKMMKKFGKMDKNEMQQMMSQQEGMDQISEGFKKIF